MARSSTTTPKWKRPATSRFAKFVSLVVVRDSRERSPGVPSGALPRSRSMRSRAVLEVQAAGIVPSPSFPGVVRSHKRGGFNPIGANRELSVFSKQTLVGELAYSPKQSIALNPDRR
jgi:hypothetical protein